MDPVTWAAGEPVDHRIRHGGDVSNRDFVLRLEMDVASVAAVLAAFSTSSNQELAIRGTGADWTPTGRCSEIGFTALRVGDCNSGRNRGQRPDRR